MKLLIISNMAHYYRDGQIVGWGPTVEEINHLSTLFESVRHIGCLHPEGAPDSALPYASEKITLVPVPPTGGNTIKEKIKIIQLTPLYISTIWRELKHADVVHLRCPANVPLLGLLVLLCTRRPVIRWAKYAGNWNAGKDYPIFYRFQRWLLKTGLTRCVVTVNGKWPGQKKYIYTFNNPCLTSQEVAHASVFSEVKQFTPPYHIVFVGAVNERKGLGRLIEIALRLQQEEIPFLIDVLGDGPEREKYEERIAGLGLADLVRFRGWIPKNKLSTFYSEAHLNLLPSESEGWPKVLSEGMAYGVVPLAGAVASIPQILNETGAGIAIAPYDDIDGYVNTIKEMIGKPELWMEYSRNARLAASKFTYDHYLQMVQDLFFFSRLGI